MSKLFSLMQGTMWSCVMLFMIVAVGGSVVGQEPADPDTSAAADAKTDSDDGASDAADADVKKDDAEDEAKDPFAVPENATAEELFAFIDQVKRNRGRTLESVKKAATAATRAAQAIREIEGVSLEDETRAIREQLSALSFLSQVDRKFRSELDELIKGLESDERPEIAKLGRLEGFKAEIRSAASASKEQQQELIAELKELLADQSLGREGFSLASSLGRTLERSDAELAASFYEDIGSMMKESDDEQVRQMAEKMIGASRRIRLPGNFMEISGTTADGEPFDWDKYRGKVVLIDFWASWCGPCRAEVPNMKRNLKLYKDKGFEIVGVNLDNSLEAYKSYVEKEEIPWVSLFSDKDGERGWNNPLATHYGISAIPTAILVDQEGKVVSMRARGTMLDKLLKDLLGEPDVDAEKMAAKESGSTDASGKWTPGENPDPQKILSEAREDTRAGRYEVALQKYIWFHENALKHQPSLVGVRLSFALSDWMRLARQYPPAMEKLLEYRDRAGEAIQRRESLRENFSDFRAFNRVLEEPEKTIAAYKKLAEEDDDAAKSLFTMVRDELIQAGEFDLAAKYIDPDRTLQSIRRSIEYYSEASKDPERQASYQRIAKFMRDRMVKDASTTVALLIKAGRDEEAKTFADQVQAEWAKTDWDDANLQSALKTALQGTFPESS